MINAIGNAVTSMIAWIGDVITAVVDSNGAMASLLPVFAIGIAVSVILVGIKLIRKLCWGA